VPGEESPHVGEGFVIHLDPLRGRRDRSVAGLILIGMRQRPELKIPPRPQPQTPAPLTPSESPTSGRSMCPAEPPATPD